MKAMARPVHRVPLWERIFALAVSGGLGWFALQAVSAGLRSMDYGYSLFGIFFVALAGIALNYGTRE